MSSGLPNNWLQIQLGEIFYTTSGGTPSRKRKDYFKGNISWLKSGELKDNIITSSEEFITEEALKNSSAKIFPKGTLLIALYIVIFRHLFVLSIIVFNSCFFSSQSVFPLISTYI